MSDIEYKWANEDITPEFIAGRMHVWRNSFWDWFVDCVYTVTEGDLDEPVKRAPAFRYLKLAHERIEASKNFVWVKSRQMYATHFMSARYLWKVMFQPYARLGIMSQKERDVQDLIETRIKPIYETLDKRFPWPSVEFKRLDVVNEAANSRIVGYAAGADQTRGKTFTELWLDELGFQENQESTMRAAIPATNGKDAKLVLVSTPVPDTLFHELCKKKDLGFEAIEHMQGVTEERNERGYTIFSVHHTADPSKRGEEWIQERIKENGWQAYEVEYNLKWILPTGKPVFGTFRRELNCKPYKAIGLQRDVPMEIGADFGGHYPAAVWFQKDSLGRCLIHKALMMEDADLETFMQEMRAIQEDEFYGMPFNLYCDPAGASVNLQGTAPPAQILMQRFFSKAVRFKRSSPADRVHAGGILINKLKGGTPGIVVAPNCGTFIDKDGNVKEGVMVDGFEYGLVFDKPRGEGKSFKGLAYKKDGFYEHLFDAWFYGFIFLWPGFVEREVASVRPKARRIQLRR